MNRNARLLNSLGLLAALLSVSPMSAQRGGRTGPPAKVGIGATGPTKQPLHTPVRPAPAVGTRPPVQRYNQAADLVVGVTRHLSGEPITALAYLQAHHPAGLLAERDERVLVGRAVRSLAARARPDPTPAEVLAHLAEVYHARDCVSAIDVRLDPPLLALEADVRDRALGVGLTRLAALTKDGKYQEARGEAEQLLDHLANATDVRARNRTADRAQFLKSLDSLSYEGFGFSWAEADGQFVVTSTAADGPANDAGLRPGDVFVRVNGRPVQQMLSTEVNALLKANDESRALTVGREGEPARDVKMTRGRVLGDTVDSLRALAQFVRAIEAVAHAEKTADALAGKDPVAAIKAVRAELLPEKLQPRVRHLQAAVALTEAVAGPARDRTDVAALKQMLALFREASGDEALTGRLHQEVAVRAMLNGHFVEARQLLPEGTSPEHAARLLRDVKGLITGTGAVTTDAARGAIEPSGGSVPPPGIRAVLPDGGGDAWRPALKEPAASDSPPLREVRKHERKWLEHAQKDFAAEREAGPRQIELALPPLDRILQRHSARAATADAFRRQMALRLGRPLTPLEMALARERALRGEDAAAVAGIFGKVNPDPLDLGPDRSRLGAVLPPFGLVPSVPPFACTHALLALEFPRTKTTPGARP